MLLFPSCALGLSMKKVLTRTAIRLQTETERLGVKIYRKVFHSIQEAMAFDPQATAIFNCTGLGAMTLGGVTDMKMFPARVRLYLPTNPLSAYLTKF